MLGMSLVYYVLLYVRMRFIHFYKSDEIHTDLENWLNIVIIDILSKTFKKLLHYFYFTCHKNNQIYL